MLSKFHVIVYRAAIRCAFLSLLMFHNINTWVSLDVSVDVSRMPT